MLRGVQGLANVVLMTSSMSLVRAKIETGIPRKRGAAQAHGSHDKAMEKFFESVRKSTD
jgi:protein pelota